MFGAPLKGGAGRAGESSRLRGSRPSRNVPHLLNRASKTDIIIVLIALRGGTATFLLFIGQLCRGRCFKRSSQALRQLSNVVEASFSTVER